MADPALRYWDDANALFGIIMEHDEEIYRLGVLGHHDEIDWYYDDQARLRRRLHEILYPAEETA